MFWAVTRWRMGRVVEAVDCGWKVENSLSMEKKRHVLSSESSERIFGMEGIPLKANRHLRFQKCLSTEYSQSASKVTNGQEDVKVRFSRIAWRWETENPEMFAEARNLHPESLEVAAGWVNRLGRTQSREERAANLGAVLSAQAHII